MSLLVCVYIVAFAHQWQWTWSMQLHDQAAAPTMVCPRLHMMDKLNLWKKLPVSVKAEVQNFLGSRCDLCDEGTPVLLRREDSISKKTLYYDWLCLSCALLTRESSASFEGNFNNGASSNNYICP